MFPLTETSVYAIVLPVRRSFFRAGPPRTPAGHPAIPRLVAGGLAKRRNAELKTDTRDWGHDRRGVEADTEPFKNDLLPGSSIA